MEPDELEDCFSDKFSSISVKTSGTIADIAQAVVSRPFFGLKEGDMVALKSPKELETINAMNKRKNTLNLFIGVPCFSNLKLL